MAKEIGPNDPMVCAEPVEPPLTRDNAVDRWVFVPAGDKSFAALLGRAGGRGAAARAVTLHMGAGEATRHSYAPPHAPTADLDWLLDMGQGPGRWGAGTAMQAMGD